MTDRSRLVDEAIEAEERELLRRIGEQPGHLDQVMSLFVGRTAWVHTVLIVVQAVMFIAGAFAAWNFFQAGDTLTALRWGLPAAVLLVVSLMLKLALWPVMNTNRVLAALKRIELLSARGPGA